MQKFFLSVLISAFTVGGAVAAEETVDFARDIYPLLKENCFKCHGPEKQKSKLRLDTREGLFKSDDVIVPGKAEESEIVYRVTRPPDDIDVMPPEGKGDPLTQAQTELIKTWINQGAKWSDPGIEVAAETDAAEKPEANGGDTKVDFARDIQPILDTLSEEQRELILAWGREGAPMPEAPSLADQKPKPAEIHLVEAPPSEAEKKAAEELRAAGVTVTQVAQNVNWLLANFRLLGKDITDDDLTPLEKMPNLTELDLSRTAITDEGLNHIKNLKNLTRLNLNNTAVTDSGLAHLSGLTNLTYLNLYGTKVNDAGLDQLYGLKSLGKIFLWQTQVTDAGAAALHEALPALDINRGLDLASLDLPSPEKKEEPSNEAPQTDDVEKTPVSIARLLLDLAAPDRPPNQESAPPKEAEPTKTSSIATLLLDLTTVETPGAQGGENGKPALATAETISNLVSGNEKESPEVRLAAETKPANPAKAASNDQSVSLAEILLQLNE